MSFLQQLVNEINQVRQNPASYAGKVEKMKKNFDGNILKLPENVGIRTKEGPKAYDECIQFLRGAPKACATTPSKGLTKIANELLPIVQKDAASLSKANLSNIIDKYGSFIGAFNRVLECGGTTPEQVVINLLVSDGETTRSQRNALLNTSLKRIGVASGPHDVFKQATIITLCTEFKNTVDADDTENYGGSSYGSGSSGSGYSGGAGSRTGGGAGGYNPSGGASKPVTTAPKSNLPMVKDKIVEQKPKEPETRYEGGLVSVDKSERVVVEGGKRKKKITYKKHFEDGHVETEVKFENI